MGGRRSKTIRQIFGKGNVSTKINLTKSINKKDTKQMSLSSFDLVFKSKPAKTNIAKAIKLMSVVAKEAAEKKGMGKNESEEYASKLWTDMKSKEKVKTPREVDKIFVSSAARVLRRRIKNG